MLCARLEDNNSVFLVEARLLNDWFAAREILAASRPADFDPALVTGFTIAGQTKSAGQTDVLNGIGSLTVNANGSYSFTPAANYFGAVPVATVTITDGVATANQLLTISLAAVNDTPTPANDSKTGAEDTNLTGSVLGNDTDIDGDRLSVSQFTVNGTDYAAGTVATLAAGSFTLGSDGKYAFTPNTSWNGIVPAITVTVTDGNLSATSTLNLTVTGVNDAPLAVWQLHAHPFKAADIQRQLQRHVENVRHFPWRRSQRRIVGDQAYDGCHAITRRHQQIAQRAEHSDRLRWQAYLFLAFAQGCVDWRVIAFVGAAAGKADLAGMAAEVFSALSQDDGIATFVMHDGNQHGRFAKIDGRQFGG
jgi:VCBS repeat-containing protein